MTKIAVIDLGSNTFHLLIAQLGADHQLTPIYRKRVFARLARGGIGLISPTSFREGLAALREFKEALDAHQVAQVKVVGTEMLRLAPNGADFVREVFEQTGLKVEIISGLREAEYIYLGVKQLFPKSSYLVMDIGGGSVEFILVKDGQQTWMVSLPIGIAVLYFRFHLSDPISASELTALQDFLSEKTVGLAEAIEEHPIEELIGASGVFETFFDVLEVPSDMAIEASKVHEKLELLIQTSLEERQQIDTIPKTRKKMIIVASVLLKFVLQLTSVKRIRYSPNSLKEGLLYSIIQDTKL